MVNFQPERLRGKWYKSKIRIFPTGLEGATWGHVLSLKTFCRILVLGWGMPIFSWPNLLVVFKMCAAICFQLFDIWLSSLDIINDFKPISRIAFFHFCEINRSLQNRLQHMFLKLLTNLVSWKLAYLISQPRTGIRQKNFRLKTRPLGVLQAH